MTKVKVKCFERFISTGRGRHTTNQAKEMNDWFAEKPEIDIIDIKEQIYLEKGQPKLWVSVYYRCKC